MAASADLAETERDAIDHAAIRLMLSYVEAECRRMGAVDAARHAAIAASLVPAPTYAKDTDTAPGRPCPDRLH
jgi:hypothetical protein